MKKLLLEILYWSPVGMLAVPLIRLNINSSEKSPSDAWLLVNAFVSAVWVYVDALLLYLIFKPLLH